MPIVQRVNLKPARFHGDWNYTVAPHQAFFSPSTGRVIF